MMSEIQNRFRELSVYNQGECFLSPAERNNVCMKLLLFNFSDKLEAKFWLVSGKLNCGKLTWFLFLKLNIFLEKCETSLKVVVMKFPVLRGKRHQRWCHPPCLYKRTPNPQLILWTFTSPIYSVFGDCWPPCKQQRFQMSVFMVIT